jgi:hypothetical protein
MHNEPSRWRKVYAHDATPFELNTQVTILDMAMRLSDPAVAHLAAALLIGVSDRAGGCNAYMLDGWIVAVHTAHCAGANGVVFAAEHDLRSI